MPSSPTDRSIEEGGGRVACARVRADQENVTGIAEERWARYRDDTERRFGWTEEEENRREGEEESERE